MVLEVSTKTATSYTKAFSKVPVLFIDGIDLLAKRDLNLCGALIALAKILTNSIIKTVLVSSEGTVMPFLQQLPATNRGLVYEIEDLEEEKAITNLMMKLTCDEAKSDKMHNYRWTNSVLAKFPEAA